MEYNELLKDQDFSSPEKIADWMYNATNAITDLLARAEKAERERDAAIKELNNVAYAINELSDMIDDEVYPVVDYSIYFSLKENVDAISMWQYELEWRENKEE